MKRLWILLLAALYCLSLTACGGSPENAQYQGKYMCEAINAEGFTLAPADFGIEAYLELNEGGKGVLYMDGSTDVKWEVAGTTLTLKAGLDRIDATIEAGLIELALDGVGTLWFVGDGGALPEDVRAAVEAGLWGDLFEEETVEEDYEMLSFYSLDAMEAEGILMTYADIEDMDGVDDTYIAFWDDGTASVNLFGEENLLYWDETCFYNETESISYTVDGDYLTLDLGDEVYLYFIEI